MQNNINDDTRLWYYPFSRRSDKKKHKDINYLMLRVAEVENTCRNV